MVLDDSGTRYSRGAIVTILNLKEDYSETSYRDQRRLRQEELVCDQLGRCFQEFNSP